MKYICIILNIFLCLSCYQNESKDINNLVKDWSHKKIIFPENAVFTNQCEDTVIVSLHNNYKILCYVDSIGCTSCKLQLRKWMKIEKKINSLFNGNIDFLFFIHPDNVNQLRIVLKRDKFYLPVCLDVDNKLNSLNNFPADLMFQTFLLNKDNQIIGIGNPVHNEKIEQFYIKILQDSLCNTY